MTIAERIAAQRAIEEVLWSHRAWPKENAGRKPTFNTVITEADLRAKVEDVLRKSNALAALWGRPITTAQLQAEMDRMAAGSQDPSTLRELFAALHDDPFVIAETLARKQLVDRNLRDWYAFDGRFHADVRARAESAIAGLKTLADLKSSGGEYRELTWVRQDGPTPAAGPAATDVIPVESSEWQALLDRLPEPAPAGTASAPPRRWLPRLVRRAPPRS